MAQLTFSEADRQALHQERFEHPHPRVQQRMEVLWLVSQGLVYAEAARLAGVSDATATATSPATAKAASKPYANSSGASPKERCSTTANRWRSRSATIRPTPWPKPASGSRTRRDSNESPPRFAPL